MIPVLVTSSKVSKDIYTYFHSDIDEDRKATCAKFLVMKEPEFMIEYYPELYLQYIGKIKKEPK